MANKTDGNPLSTMPDYGVIHMADSSIEETLNRKVAAVLLLLNRSNEMMRRASLSKEREVRVDMARLPDEIASQSESVEHIEQGYIVETDDGETIVRARMSQVGQDAPKYTITAKNYPSFDEAETDISKEIFDGLKDILSRMEIKDRYHWNGWDVDVITGGDRAGRVVAEYELPEDEISVKMPDVIKNNLVSDTRD